MAQDYRISIAVKPVHRWNDLFDNDVQVLHESGNFLVISGRVQSVDRKYHGHASASAATGIF